MFENTSDFRKFFRILKVYDFGKIQKFHKQVIILKNEVLFHKKKGHSAFS